MEKEKKRPAPGAKRAACQAASPERRRKKRDATISLNSENVAKNKRRQQQIRTYANRTSKCCDFNPAAATLPTSTQHSACTPSDAQHTFHNISRTLGHLSDSIGSLHRLPDHSNALPSRSATDIYNWETAFRNHPPVTKTQSRPLQGLTSLLSTHTAT